jgi:hypothetical protein
MKQRWVGLGRGTVETWFWHEQLRGADPDCLCTNKNKWNTLRYHTCSTTNYPVVTVNRNIIPFYNIFLKINTVY